jgi:iron complex transport system ATP-binding protein
METKDECDMNIAVRDLGFSYPNGKRVFEHLTFDITQGRILSILGPNGAGKSTLLGCIARLYIPDRGDVLFDGKSYRRMQQQEIACAIGFVPQHIIPSFDYRVLDYVVTGCAPRMGAFQKPKAAEYEVAWKAIQTMGLEHIAEQSITKISGGERQQVAIARVIVQKPSVILLDEPTSHLDFGNQMKVLKMLRRMADDGYGVVMTTHNPDHVLLLDDQVAVLDQGGKLTFGMGREILNEEFLSNLYGTKLRLFDIDELGRRVCVAQGIG